MEAPADAARGALSSLIITAIRYPLSAVEGSGVHLSFASHVPDGLEG